MDDAAQTSDLTPREVPARTIPVPTTVNGVRQIPFEGEGAGAGGKGGHGGKKFQRHLVSGPGMC